MGGDRGLLDEAQATAGAAPIVAIALEKHPSWCDFAEQLLLGLEFAEGEIEPALRASIAAIDGPAWPDADAIPEIPLPAAVTVDEADGAPSAAGEIIVLALRLAVDCPGCENALAFGDIVVRASCRLCGTEVALAPAEWAYFFADAKKRLRAAAMMIRSKTISAIASSRAA